MLVFAERLQKEIRMQRQDVESRMIGGEVRNMEHYKYLQGRRESLTLIEDWVRDFLGSEEDRDV